MTYTSGSTLRISSRQLDVQLSRYSRLHPLPQSSYPADQEPCQRRWWRGCKQVVPRVAFRELVGDEPAADFISFQRFHPPGSDHLARLSLVPWDEFIHTSCLQLVALLRPAFLDHHRV